MNHDIHIMHAAFFSGPHDLQATSNLFQSNIDLGNSYSCGDAKLTFDSAPINYTLNATLSITNLRVQAFSIGTDGKLSAGKQYFTSEVLCYVHCMCTHSI